MNDYTLFEALRQWLSGKSLTSDSIYHFPMIWLARIGQALQFTGGLTVIAEILGREKISQYRSKIERLIDLKVVLKTLQDESVYCFFISDIHIFKKTMTLLVIIF